MADSPGIVALLGASRTGKSFEAKARMARRRGRVLAWSPLESTDGYAPALGAHLVRTLSELLAALQAGRQRVVLWPQDDCTRKVWLERFSTFCKIAWRCPGAAVLVEELSRVTYPSYAPEAWKNLCTAGMHERLFIIGTAQRPAQIDKDFLGNCTEVRSYRLVYETDARTVAGVLRCPPEDLMQLPRYHYIQRNLDTLATTRGGPKAATKRK